MKCYKKDYPRPQFVRENWENLNGEWNFSFDDKNCGEKEKWYISFPEALKIQVPFTYETKLSGIQDETCHNQIWYQRNITVNQRELNEHRLMLHFEGSDFCTKVWVNGQYAGEHKGGYSRFSFDITNMVKVGENSLTVKVEDSFNTQQPRGKQRWVNENFGCWYVQTTGIWKTVWTEYVPETSLESAKMTPVLSKGVLELEYQINAAECTYKKKVEVTAEVSFKDILINQTVTRIESDSVKVTLDVAHRGDCGFEWGGIRPWSPESPELYDITFKVAVDGKVTDIITSYFAMREIRIDGPNILLNGRPIYQRLILDQGYWKDSHLTPPSEEALLEDIDKIHALGYNGLRKHQKIEDERFLYWCDVKGMLVWSEMAAAYEYSDNAVEEFAQEWIKIVRQNYNHPCIITWTPVNESWGVSQVETVRTEQHFTEMIYHLTKSMDPYRPVIVNDGWEHTVSDIITLHDYEENGDIFYKRYVEYQKEILNSDVYHCGFKSAMANGYTYHGQPVIISEYGGIAFNNDDSGWGYGNKVNTKEEFIKRFDDITTAVKKLPYCCGFCYTQVTDVQQEINGLMDIDRNFKVDPKVIREINERRVGYWRA